MIPFNKPYITGNENKYINDVISRGKISGNGFYTNKCQTFFREKYGFKHCLLTTSCTDALEMAAILIDIKYGDEVIMPSYTFVSTANAFVLRGAKIVFADSEKNCPNIDVQKIEALISNKTKAIVAVHYAGIACDMDNINLLAKKYNLFVIEDSAQAIDSFYNNKTLGSLGDIAAFSFHDTKNIISGEGGLLVVNNENFIKRSEIIWEKGTNRAEFFRGEVNKYGWVDVGSSFLPSELIAAFLFAQLENIDNIQAKRKHIWELYYNHLNPIQNANIIKLPEIPNYASNNAHMFYLICNTIDERNNLIKHLKNHDIYSVFHYLSLHKSEFYKNKHDNRELINSDNFENCLLRLPLYYELSDNEILKICNLIKEYFKI
ncbi:MAG: dTDP-4-amino-4,6-dideoxygalactose transaminase [Bacteroidetes bacterium GWA2_30_7]|nr:MAG: dTDP-4-amino-4,6-dideoxygalactose transaminase [Bacteroidetes bacterium GWA2_30_7]